MRACSFTERGEGVGNEDTNRPKGILDMLLIIFVPN